MTDRPRSILCLTLLTKSLSSTGFLVRYVFNLAKRFAFFVHAFQLVYGFAYVLAQTRHIRPASFRKPRYRIDALII